MEEAAAARVEATREEEETAELAAMEAAARKQAANKRAANEAVANGGGHRGGGRRGGSQRGSSRGGGYGGSWPGNPERQLEMTNVVVKDDEVAVVYETGSVASIIYNYRTDHQQAASQDHSISLQLLFTTIFHSPSSVKSLTMQLFDEVSLLLSFLNFVRILPTLVLELQFSGQHAKPQIWQLFRLFAPMRLLASTSCKSGNFLDFLPPGSLHRLLLVNLATSTFCHHEAPCIDYFLMWQLFRLFATMRLLATTSC
eukprot:284819737_5